MASNVLSSRDVNTSAPTTTTNLFNEKTVIDENDNKPKSMEFHRQVLQSRLDEDKSKQTYISPSDTIMSPCTAKLSAYKSKHFMKAKPQSLFAKTSSKNLAAAEKGQDSTPQPLGEDIKASEGESKASETGI